MQFFFCSITLKPEGTATLVRSYIENARPGYVATVKVYLDGKWVKTVNVPADMHNRKQELYWNYDLEESDHEIELRWENPEEGTKVHCTNIITYKKK